MTWFKVDDNAAMHPKMVAAGNPALGLWLRCGAWSASLLTDGFVPASMVALFAGRPVDVRRLVHVRLWHTVTDGQLVDVDPGCCPIGRYGGSQGDGYQFHEWNREGRQPTRDEIETRRAQDRDRKKAAREARAARNGHTNGHAAHPQLVGQEVT